jgi:hypothetical protein
MPKYDNGERWDLKAKYTDEGYEDADADVMGKFMVRCACRDVVTRLRTRC